MVKWRRPARSSFSPVPTARRATLTSGKERAGQLLERGNVEEAFAILAPLAGDFPQDAELQMMLGTCYLGMGEPDAALSHFERAYALDKDPRTLVPLGLACLELAMYAGALYAFTESVRRGVPLPQPMHALVKDLRQDVAVMAEEVGLPLEKAIAGIREMERGRRWLHLAEYGNAIAANRAAIKLLGDWPVPHNNLALALFFDGQVAAAIAECRQVLARAPDNITAACNLVRCLAWSGAREEAQALWQPLRTYIPVDLPTDALKFAETAAVMDDDETVRRVLLPLGDWPPEELGERRYYLQVQHFLATADANLGNPKAAKRRLRDLDDEDRHVQLLHRALRQGKTGLGLTARFSYYHSHELAPAKVAQEFAAQLEAAGDAGDPQAVKALHRLAARFPQLAVMAEKAIWEEDDVEFGLLALQYLGTPAAHAALRRFAGGQAGSDKQRVTALLYLQLCGGTQPGETFRIWRNGAWQELQPRGFKIRPRASGPPRNAKAAKLLAQGQAAMRAEQWGEAAALFRQVIELEPRAFEAYNNLAAALDMRGEREASSALLEQALTINPTYVFARANLALRVIHQDLDAAAAYLEPLAELTLFTPDEFVFYQYALARVAVGRNDYEAARGMLDSALTIAPEYEPALKLLALVDSKEFMAPGGPWEQFRERMADQQARYRRQQQARLATLTPAVADVVGIYTAELLRPIARAVAPSQRTSGLRKAELQQRLIESLFEPATIAYSVNHALNDAERAALAAVLDAGGAMPQQQFRQAYGDDAAESPWWQHAMPASVAGRLRLHCLLVETTVDGVVYLAVPAELREPLATALRARL